MLERTRTLWDKQFNAVGDRRGLFDAVADTVEANDVLYPGSYVDLTPSFVWPSVTYVDVDRRANQFFGDADGIDELLREHGVDSSAQTTRFLHADYADQLDVADESVDLLISLYAGFISEHCTRYLRPGGHLLVNPSHGDTAMASLDTRYELCGAVVSNGDTYEVRTGDLDAYLVPKRDIEVTVELLHETGRAIAYTKSAFAYLFRRTS